MRFANFLQPQLMPSDHEIPPEKGFLKEQILAVLLKISVVFGLFLLIPGLYTAVVLGNWILAFIQIILFSILVIDFQRKSLIYAFRAQILLAVIYLTTFLISQFNLSGLITQFLLLNFVLLSTILFNFKSGFIAATISMITILLSKLIPAINVGINSPEAWISQGGIALPEALFFFGASIALAFCVSIALHVFEINLVATGQKLLLTEKKLSILLDQSQQDKQRLQRLRTVAEVSHTANMILEPELLLDQLPQLIRKSFEFAFVGIYLNDELKEYAVLQASTGESKEGNLADRPRVIIGGSSIIGQAIQSKKVVTADNTGTQLNLNKNPDSDFFNPIVDLAIPLIAGNEAIGAIMIQLEQQQAINEFDIECCQNMADSLAIAIQNSLLFAYLEKHTEEIEALNRQYIQTGWSGHLNDYVRLQHTFQSLEDPVENQIGEIYTTPLFIREQIIGELAIEKITGSWSQEDISLIQTVAAQAAQALENARLLQETQQKALQEQLLGNFSSQVRESFDIDAILRTAMREFGDNFNLAEVRAFVGWEEE